MCALVQHAHEVFQWVVDVVSVQGPFTLVVCLCVAGVLVGFVLHYVGRLHMCVLNACDI